MALPPNPTSPPLSIEPVLGWRAWRLVRVNGELRLGSLVHPGAWWPQRTVPARCAAYPTPRAHTAPAGGLHLRVLRDRFMAVACARRTCSRTRSRSSGAIAMWGTVVEHGRGARSEFAYPARLRLVCGPCLKLQGGPRPGAGRGFRQAPLAPLRHSTRELPTGVPAADVQAELLDTYAVELLPKPRSPCRGVSASRRAEGAGARPGRHVGGLGGLQGDRVPDRGRVRAVDGGACARHRRRDRGRRSGSSRGRRARRARRRRQRDASVASPFIYHVELKLHGGVEPHRGVSPVPPPPSIALTCGVGHGDRVEFVDCAGPRVDLLGFRRTVRSAGRHEGLLRPDDAYSSGPHWYACWFAPGDGAWVDPFPASPNPFVHPLGGAFH